MGCDCACMRRPFESEEKQIQLSPYQLLYSTTIRDSNTLTLELKNVEATTKDEARQFNIDIEESEPEDLFFTDTKRILKPCLLYTSDAADE